MAREIPLTRGLVALVDDEDFEWLSQWRWTSISGPNVSYARRRFRSAGRRVIVPMHRAIMDAPAGTFVDHINGDGLDNRRANLRLSSNSENQRNRGPSKLNRTGFKGVCLDSERGCFRVFIQVENISVSLGRFDCPAEAARAYDAAARRLHGAFARLNFPEPA